MDKFNGLCIEGANYTQWLNDNTFFDYYTRLKEIAINEFEWINLPPTCDARFLELLLFDFGYALFFQHNLNKAFLTLQCTISGALNMYRIPIRRRAYAITGFNQECSDEDSVLIFNNYLRQPTALTVRLYAEKLTELDRTLMVNIKAQKTPALIRGTVNQQRALKALYSKYDGNEPVIFGDKDLDVTQLTVLKTDAPSEYLNLLAAKQQIWNEALTFFGIDNANTYKRERVITSEVESNNQIIEISRLTRLNSRKDACKWINQLFATQLEAPVDVRFRMEGGMLDEPIYNGTEDGMRSPDRDGEEGRISSDRYGNRSSQTSNL